MKHTKLLVLALLVALLACLALAANAECAHPYDKWTELDRRDATCTTDGSVTWQCKNCGTIWYENLPNLGGHIRSGYFVEANAGTRKACEAKLMVEVCGRHTSLGGKCTHVFTDNQYTSMDGVSAHTWTTISPAYPASCTADGHKALTKCSVCGAVKPGEDGSATKATGHSFTKNAWVTEKVPTCAAEGKISLKCDNCTFKQYQATPKATVHTKADGTVKTGDEIYDLCFLPAKPRTCTEPGCKAVYKCSTCQAIDPLRDGSAIPAWGHNMVVDTTMTKLPTCTTKGQSVLYCTHSWNFGSGEIKCQHYQMVESPALGHSATWAPVENKGDYTVWELRCAKCGTVLATQLVMKGEKAPSGTVNTATTATTKSYKAATTGTTKVAKTNTTKKTTTKKATTTTATKAATTAAAAAPAAEGVEIKATGITVINDDVAIKVKDGKLIVLGEAAEDETVAVVGEELKAIAEDEAFVAGMKIAVVKTADLPAATASK